MIIFLNADGTAEKVTPEHVYQGSNNVTAVTVVAPYAATTAMQIGFVLPSGLYWASSDNQRYVPMTLAVQEVTTLANVWTYSLPLSVTEQMGELGIAINAITATGNRTSYLCKVQIEESVLPDLSTTPEPGAYDILLQYLIRLDQRTENVPNLVKSIQKVASNAFTYTTNNGVTSAPIVLTGDGGEAPIAFGAASVISIPESAWQPIYGSNNEITGYRYLILAAAHGQMTEGVTPNDLWVSFDEVGTSEFTGAYEDYTVNTFGDIAIDVTTPIAMTVRVWNGKGLIDQAKYQAIIDAEANSAQSAQNAEQAAQRAEQASTEAQGTANAVEDYVNQYLADFIIRVANRTLIINPTADNITVNDRTLIFTAEEV